MKKTRRMTAVIAAMTLTAAMAVPNMMMTASAASIEITNISKDIDHTFEVYQIFTGTLATDGTFSNLKWGEGASKYENTDVTKETLVDPDIVDAVSGMDATAIIKKITLSSTKACDDVTSSNGTASITGLADGYYLVKDVTNLNNEDDANSAWIVQVAGTTSIEIKNAKPTVDKQILDETDDAETGATNGWGESADHAINEKFQFKLTATIPADADYAAYETYKLVFNDTLSKGITFDQIDSVKATSTTLTGTNAKTLATTDYTKSNITTDTSTGAQAWTLTIADIKSIVDTNTLGTNNAAKPIFGKEVITVEVVYTAHLNSDAIISSADGTGVNTNNNKVNLTYSNNPNTGGTGKTADDYVWCFTYGVNNTKYQVEEKAGNELAGAGFTLYTDSNKTTAIKLIDNEDGTYTVADQSATTGVITEMTSNTNGVFNIKGLDAGTYCLAETTVPDGYTKAADTTIVIDAVHVENATSGADLTMEADSSHLNNPIVDTKNNSLPSTGGMGTLFFRLGGGVSAALLGVYLVSKKRAKKETAE